MPGRTLQQVIDAAKAGEAVSPDECREAMLALHSMYTKYLMSLEAIADTMENPTSLYYITRAYLGCPEVLRAERERWMNTVPAEYLKEIMCQCANKLMCR
jgi:hypothetical protein